MCAVMNFNAEHLSRQKHSWWREKTLTEGENKLSLSPTQVIKINLSLLLFNWKKSHFVLFFVLFWGFLEQRRSLWNWAVCARVCVSDAVQYSRSYMEFN